MKKLSFLLAGAYLVIPCNYTHGYGAGNTSESPAEKKQKVNFYGTLSTQQGNVIDVENITIDGRYRQIPMFERPTVGKNAETKSKRKNAAKEIALDVDPSNDLVTTYIDLNETSEITVPHPDEVWVYQREDSRRKVRYIELAVMSKDEPRTKRHYLIEYRAKIYCHGISKSGPEEKKVPMPAVKTLIIEGFCTRSEETGQCLIPPYELLGRGKKTANVQTTVVEEVTPTTTMIMEKTMINGGKQ